MLLQDFPLAWPEGVKRTPAEERAPASFRVAFKRAFDDLVGELERIHDDERRDVVVSTNLPLDAGGLPVFTSKRVADPGVAVYVWRGGRAFAMACDVHADVRDNLRALCLKIRYSRAAGRYRTSDLAEAMAGFCWEIEAPEQGPPQKLLRAGT